MISCSSEDEASENNIFDPDGIAHVNNGEDFNFEEYEKVWTPENGSEEEVSGIVNVPWTLFDGDDIYSRCFVTDKNFANGRYKLQTPYYIYCINGTEWYAGTFNLYKKANGFYIQTVIDKKLNQNLSWESIQKEEKLYRYTVFSEKLIFID